MRFLSDIRSARVCTLNRQTQPSAHAGRNSYPCNEYSRISFKNKSDPSAARSPTVSPPALLVHSKSIFLANLLISDKFFLRSPLDGCCEEQSPSDNIEDLSFGGFLRQKENCYRRLYWQGIFFTFHCGIFWFHFILTLTCIIHRSRTALLP